MSSHSIPNYRYQILQLMWKSHPWLTIGSAVTGIIGGSAAIAVVDTVNTVIHSTAKRPHLLPGKFVRNSMFSMSIRMAWSSALTISLAKALTGLYSPATGQILLDGEPVYDNNKESYQSLFAAVFTDFHLFDRMIGPGWKQPTPPLLGNISQGLDWRRRFKSMVKVTHRA